MTATGDRPGRRSPAGAVARVMPPMATSGRPRRAGRDCRGADAVETDDRVRVALVAGREHRSDTRRR